MAKTKELSKIVDLHKEWATRPSPSVRMWWEGDNSWCDYSQMEETQNNC